MSNIKKGEKNPMYGKPKSDAFLACQTRDKTGANNPQYGVKKSEETLAKLFPLKSRRCALRAGTILYFVKSYMRNLLYFTKSNMRIS